MVGFVPHLAKYVPHLAYLVKTLMSEQVVTELGLLAHPATFKSIAGVDA